MQVKLSLIALLVLTLAGTAAEARKERELGWRFGQVWATSVRLLRVDMKCTILEKDKDTGYLLFECAGSGKPSTGSLELVRASESESASLPFLVKAALHMDSLPSYMESLWLDKLEKKLKRDYGTPLVLAPSASQSQGKLPQDGRKADGQTVAPDSIEDEDDIEVDEEKLEDANEEK